MLGLDVALKCRLRSKRGRALVRLQNADGDFVSRSELMFLLYGNTSKETREPVRLLVKGVRYLIRDRRLPFKLVKVRKDREIYYALKPR